MSKKIFIIEDDENILYGLQEKFSSDGYDTEISSADEDLETITDKIKKSNPDAVVLDLLLPKIDGLDIVKKIKEDPEMTEIPFVIFTDLSDEDAKNRSTGLGVNHYFLKSDLDVNEFSEKVETILGDKESDETAVDEEGDDVILD